ncbi:MAG: hypothetical protein AAFY11_12810 [Cyanobacteria bacterium J06641_5]
MQFEVLPFRMGWNWLGGWKNLYFWLGLGLMLASVRVPFVSADEPPPWLFRGKPGGGREELGTDKLCMISPLPNDYLLSNRPKFIWQGSESRLEVLSEHEEDMLWSHTPNTDREKPYEIVTSTVSLLPEQWYVLRLFDSSGQVAYSERFYVARARQKIIKEHEDTAQALMRAQELSEGDYWSDAMGILFSIPVSEGLIAEYRQAVSDRYCSE